MSEIIKKRGDSTKNIWFYLPILLLIVFSSAQTSSAQDLPGDEEIASTMVFSNRKKLKSYKSPIVKPKVYESAPAVKPRVYASAPIVKSKVSAPINEKNPRPIKVAPVQPVVKVDNRDTNEDLKNNPATSEILKNYPTIAVSGIVRLKQYNQAAAGVLIEAVRIDTREMIDSTETDGAGEFKFKELPAGAAVVFLVSSTKIRPYMFKANIEAGMKNLEFSVISQ